MLKDDLSLFENKIDQVSTRYLCSIRRTVKNNANTVTIKLKIEYQCFINDILFRIIEDLSNYKTPIFY
jgi:hypothetical protein